MSILLCPNLGLGSHPPTNAQTPAEDGPLPVFRRGFFRMSPLRRPDGLPTLNRVPVYVEHSQGVKACRHHCVAQRLPAACSTSLVSVWVTRRFSRSPIQGEGAELSVTVCTQGSTEAELSAPGGLPDCLVAYFSVSITAILPSVLLCPLARRPRGRNGDLTGLEA